MAPIKGKLHRRTGRCLAGAERGYAYACERRAFNHLYGVGGPPPMVMRRPRTRTLRRPPATPILLQCCVRTLRRRGAFEARSRGAGSRGSAGRRSAGHRVVEGQGVRRRRDADLGAEEDLDGLVPLHGLGKRCEVSARKRLNWPVVIRVRPAAAAFSAARSIAVSPLPVFAEV